MDANIDLLRRLGKQGNTMPQPISAMPAPAAGAVPAASTAPPPIPFAHRGSVGRMRNYNLTPLGNNLALAAGGINAAKNLTHKDENGNWDPQTGQAAINLGVGALPKLINKQPISLASKAAPLGTGMKILGRGVAGMGALSAYDRWQQGDRLGASIDAISTIGHATPHPVGQVVGFGADAVGAARDFYNDNYGENSPAAIATREVVRRGVPTLRDDEIKPQFKKYGGIKMSADSQFRKDLANPSAGLDSDLYGAVSPMINNPGEELKGGDAENASYLNDQVRKGLVGLEYLTGLKKNTEESFYDAHPVEAVATDALRNSAGIGAGVAGLGVASNFLNQYKNMKNTERAYMARKDNPLDASNASNLLDPTDKSKVRSDISGIFGDFEGDPAKRLEVLDSLNKVDVADPKSFSKRYSELKGTKDNITRQYDKALVDLNKQLAGASPDQVKKIEAQLRSRKDFHSQQTEQFEKLQHKLFSEAKGSKGYAALPEYADLHETLRRAKEKGGLKSFFGEGIHNLEGDSGIVGFLKKHIAPDKHQALGDLLEKRKLTGANPHFDEELIKKIISSHRGGGDFSALDPEGKAFVETTLSKLKDPKFQSSGIMKALSRMKTPLAAGAGIALGGTGLYHLVKAIQSQVHSKEKTRDWKKTLLKARGDFEGADKIQ